MVNKSLNLIYLKNLNSSCSVAYQKHYNLNFEAMVKLKIGIPPILWLINQSGKFSYYALII